MNNKIVDIIKKFLLENDAYIKFIDNFYHTKHSVGKNNQESIDDFITYYEYNCIVYAFLWSKTPEGRDYWSNIDKKLKKIENEK